MFDDIEIEKRKLQRYKYPCFLEDIDIDNIWISNKVFSGEENYRYFIGYADGEVDNNYDNYKAKPFCTMHPQTST